MVMLLAVTNDGQISSGTDPNKTVTTTTYVKNTNNGLLVLPAVTSTQDVNNKIISKTSFYYDGDTIGSASPLHGPINSQGQLVRKQYTTRSKDHLYL